MTPDPCPYCGAPGVGGLEGCQARLYALQLDRALPLTGGLGRALFDGYCLQHPEVYCVSSKSYAAHLAFFAAWVRFEGDAVMLERAQRGFNGPFLELKAPVLEKRGALTILHLEGATDLHDLERRIREWLRSVWQAYAPLHAQAFVYLDGALERGGRG